MPRPATIRAPEAPANLDALPIVLVNGARNARIDVFVIQGPPPIVLCSPTILAGVMVERGGEVTVRRSVISTIRPVDQALDWCFRGYRVHAVATSSEPATRVVVNESRIDACLTDGVHATGADATPERSEIVGDGITAGCVQVGVEISVGAGAALDDNDIRLHTDRAQSVDIAPDAARATGISVTRTTGIAASAGLRSNTFEGNSMRSIGNAQPARTTAAGVTPDIFPGAGDVSGGAAHPWVTNPIDCIDSSTGDGLAGTANEWLGNTGLTAIPVDFCGSG